MEEKYGNIIRTGLRLRKQPTTHDKYRNKAVEKEQNEKKQNAISHVNVMAQINDLVEYARICA